MSLLYSSKSPDILCWNESVDCSLCPWSNLTWSEDHRIEILRRYSYGIALPSICLLGIVGNVLNLVVLTRRNMKGTAYIYMRGKSKKNIHLFLPRLFEIQIEDLKGELLLQRDNGIRKCENKNLIK